MTFTIHPLEPTDYVEAFAVSDLSFASFNALLHTSYPLSPESSTKLTEARLNAMQNLPKASMFKAVDETGRIVGASRLIVAVEDEAVGSVGGVVDQVLERSVRETNVAATRGYYTMATEGKRDVLGTESERGEVVKITKRVELEVLFTHPEFQGRGVGRALLQLCLDEADKLGLVVFLEATEQGRPLYERAGFEVVREVVFDAGDFGGRGRHHCTVSPLAVLGGADYGSLCFGSLPQSEAMGVEKYI